jgi:hypothetical protein
MCFPTICMLLLQHSNAWWRSSILQRFMLRRDSTTILNSHHIIATYANNSERQKLYMCTNGGAQCPGCNALLSGHYSAEWMRCTSMVCPCACTLVGNHILEIMECDFPPDEQEGMPCWPTWCGYILQNVMLPMSSFQSMKALWVHCLFGILIVPDNSEG